MSISRSSTDSEFIQETLDVLESDNISNKKNYFIDNQVYVTDSLKESYTSFLQLLEDNAKDQNARCGFNTFTSDSWNYY